MTMIVGFMVVVVMVMVDVMVVVVVMVGVGCCVVLMVGLVYGCSFWVGFVRCFGGCTGSRCLMVLYCGLISCTVYFI